VGVFLVYNTLAVAAKERRHDIGLLRSVGATRLQVAALFLGEAVLLGLVGSALGLPAGLGLAQLSLGPAQQALGDLFVPLSSQGPEITPESLLGAAGAGVAAALLAGILPALQAARENAVDALRRVPLAPARGGRWLRAGGSVALVLLGLGYAGLKERLPPLVGSCGGLVLVLAALLLATPLLVTFLIRLLQPPARALLGVSGRLALDNLERAPGRTGLVVAGLAAGVALLVQTAGLIRSNEAAVRDWVDRSIAGDLFVTCGGPLSASGRTLPMGEDAAGQLHEALPGIQVVPIRFRYLDWEHEGRPVRVLLLALDAAAYHEANRQRQPPLPDLELFRGLAEPGTALVSENFAALHGIGAGDTITLPGVDGPVPLRVLGTVADFSCKCGTVMVDRGRYRREFDTGLADLLDVYLPAGADAAAARERLTHSAAGERGLCVLTRGEVRGHILGMIDRLYSLAYAQEAVVGIVALLGLVSALLISVLQRQRELGLLRAVGATRAQVLRSVLAEALLLGGIGVFLGLAVGWPLEWYTVRVLLFEESGFPCPVRFPWATAAGITALTLAGAAAAGLGPALYAVRTGIVESISYE
jgi:putative ABC transport system permease protein